MSTRDIYQKTQREMAKKPFEVVHSETPFLHAYTVGALPHLGFELYIEGVSGKLAEVTCEIISNLLCFYSPHRPESFPEILRLDGMLRGGCSLALIRDNTDALRSSFMPYALSHHDLKEFDVVQVVVPDATGVFPWEASDSARGFQKVYRTGLGDLHDVKRNGLPMQSIDLSGSFERPVMH